MSKPIHFEQPHFRKTRIPQVRLAHIKPLTWYTRWRWLVQALVVVAFVAVPALHILKLDLANDQYWLFGARVSRVLALQAVLLLWLGAYFINFFENYLVGRLLCGWICPWGLLNRIGMIVQHKLRHSPRREAAFLLINMLGATIASLVVLNWGFDLGVLWEAQHEAFWITWGLLLTSILIGFLVLQRLGFKFCENICPFGMYLTVVTQKNSLRVVFDSNRACVDCGLCTQVCPMDLSPREMEFEALMEGGFGQCILCGDCIDVCIKRMDLEALPAPLRWNLAGDIIPLEPIDSVAAESR